MMHPSTRAILASLISLSVLLSACSTPSQASPTSLPTNAPVSTDVTATPFQPSPTTPAPTATAAPEVSLWIDPSLPVGFSQNLAVPGGIRQVEQADQAAYSIQVISKDDASQAALAVVDWIYALVVPFDTITDGVTGDEFRQAWQGTNHDLFLGAPILLDQTTLQVMEKVLGPVGEGVVEVTPTSDLLDTAWSRTASWAIVPFENLAPRWKVLTIDGTSPIKKDFDPSSYLLTARIGITGSQEGLSNLTTAWGAADANSILPASNRDPEKMTVLIMTGVTALVRATAYKMEIKGVTYPGQDIRDILRSADITHISNEVSFAEDCPYPDPGTYSLRFCSDPKYIELLEDVGTDVVELTGNHMNDWGTEAMAYSLNLYKEHNLPVYAGGMNVEEARAALILEDHGNKIAFIGCNPAGPEYVWATETEPGAANCDYDWMHAEIKRLSEQGILVVSTFQYEEAYGMRPMPWQQTDFKGMVGAGATIVSGSQSHYPQAMEFLHDSFIHYGLGNLFFDQQNYIDVNTGELVEGTRWEFADQYVIYDGKLISTELLTFMLEDFAKPRVMTAEERASLLSQIFDASDW